MAIRPSGNGGGGQLNLAAITKALAAKGLTDAQARTALGAAATVLDGLIAIGVARPPKPPSIPAKAIFDELLNGFVTDELLNAPYILEV